MGDLTKNFDRKEYACRGKSCCGGSAPVMPALAAGVQRLRDLAGVPLKMSCGFRCNRHNAEVGNSSPDSQHTLGAAADVLVPPGWTADRLAALAETIDAFRDGGIGVYESWVHVDVRPGRARWRG
jgi:uncharacterized protein YcbK (DUF882 family)